MDAPRLPLPPRDPLAQEPRPVNMCFHYWADDRYPYLPFVRTSPFIGPLMSRFANFDSHRLVKGSVGWHLPHDTGKEWKVFERTLYSTADALLTLFKEKHPEIKCLWTPPKKPSAYGYFDTQKTEKAALAVAKDSIAGFVLYMAYTSFLIGLLQACGNSWAPQTVADLLEASKSKLHPAWAAELEESGVGVFDHTVAHPNPSASSESFQRRPSPEGATTPIATPLPPKSEPGSPPKDLLTAAAAALSPPSKPDAHFQAQTQPKNLRPPELRQPETRPT
ncbi:hypothetical protein GALMADRAFT_148398 [Galerina marginata CBS 339.88]|uniref:Uncharacterized protein n=1 Tax=Galerina marginata (strain CBS 339.88) TaxID=685588 RepID=A0A067SGC0_GALM3|nr:hypothetical protein GALMADRAFT_148398 [Galerina marginata CBS 339.88]